MASAKTDTLKRIFSLICQP